MAISTARENEASFLLAHKIDVTFTQNVSLDELDSVPHRKIHDAKFFCDVEHQT